MATLAAGQKMMNSFIAEYGHYIKWITLTSSICFFASLLIIPWIICKLEADFFLHLHEPKRREKKHPLLCLLLRLLRYLLGSTLLTAGILMLFLPGQGLLTIILGLSLLDFPGKRQAVDGLLNIHSIQTALNWIRDKGKKKQFIFPPHL